MKEAQKEYTVRQIEKYKDEAEKFDKKADKNKWFIFGAAVLSFTCFYLSGDITKDLNELAGKIVEMLGLSSILSIIIDIKSMVENIVKKVSFESKAEDLQQQLNLDKLADYDEEKPYTLEKTK